MYILICLYLYIRMAAKKLKKKDIITVDHSKVDYEDFQKSFYIEPPELKNLATEEVESLRDEFDGIKIRVSIQVAYDRECYV